MITVMTGQVVDFFDQDFRELYAISEKLDLYKEFHVSPPAAPSTAKMPSKAGTKRPPLPATTSRFQVALGDSGKDKIEVPAHKYYNPKYSLLFADPIRPTGSLQEPGPTRGTILSKFPEELEQEKTLVTSSERMDRLTPLPAEAPSEIFKGPKAVGAKKGQHTWRLKLFKKSSRKLSESSLANSTCPSPTETIQTGETEDNPEVIVRTPSKWRGKKVQRTESQQTVNSAKDTESKSVKCGFV